MSPPMEPDDLDPGLPQIPDMMYAKSLASTTLASAASSGDTSLTVVSVDGIGPGDNVQIGDAAVADMEARTVTFVHYASGTINLSAPLNASWEAGQRVFSSPLFGAVGQLILADLPADYIQLYAVADFLRIDDGSVSVSQCRSTGFFYLTSSWYEGLGPRSRWYSGTNISSASTFTLAALTGESSSEDDVFSIEYNPDSGSLNVQRLGSGSGMIVPRVTSLVILSKLLS